MEAISFLSGWVTWLLVIIPTGAGTIVTYQAVKKSLSDDEDVIYECSTKIRNTVYGAAIAMTVSGLVTILKSFYV